VTAPEHWTARHADRAALDRDLTLDSIGDLEVLRARRTAAAADGAAAFPPRGPIAYGPGPGETLLLVPPTLVSGPAPVQVFIHGGFWSSMEAAQFTFLSRGFAPFGAALAILDYPLIPAVRLGDVVAACKRAILWLRANAQDHHLDPERIFVSGNSAGGHLVAELMDDPDLAFLRGGAALSGLYDLAPVAASFQNDVLALDEGEVARLSPLVRPPRVSAPMIVAVGGRETKEFLWQSDAYAAHLRRGGVPVETMVVPATDHITVVLDALADPDAPLNRAVRRQMGLPERPDRTGRWTISSGSRFEALAGYSRAVVDGDWIFVSGTAGYAFPAGTIADDPADQARQCLATIAKALAEADASLADVVRIRVYVSERAHVMPVSRVLGEAFSDPRPANTTIVCGFAEEAMKVELEVTALKRR
jgi:arylformamidase